MKKSIQSKYAFIYQKDWLHHLLLWVGLVVLFNLFRAIRTDSLTLTWGTLLFEIIPFSGMASAVYINLKILLPRFLVFKKYKSYAIGLLMVAGINALIVYGLFNLFEPLAPEFPKHPHPSRWLFFPSYMTMQILFTFITSFFHYVRENNRLTEIALGVKEVESNRLRAELNSLKAQINPHFLFNTLNNIYSYSLFKSEKTPEMILKLSELMNYIIYECQADQVRLEKEVAFIHNYIDLERMRVEDSLLIELDIHEDVMDYRVAPLLFVPFLENAFKHGANVSRQKPFIKIKLNLDDHGQLVFESANLKEDYEADELLDKQGGIGLENVKKRLELLYPERSKLEIDDSGDQYCVKLTLQLEAS